LSAPSAAGHRQSGALPRLEAARQMRVDRRLRGTAIVERRLRPATAAALEDECSPLCVGQTTGVESREGHVDGPLDMLGSILGRVEDVDDHDGTARTQKLELECGQILIPALSSKGEHDGYS